MNGIIYKTASDQSGVVDAIFFILQKIKTNSSTNIIEARDVYSKYIKTFEENEKSSLKKLYTSKKLAAELIIFQGAFENGRRYEDIRDIDLSGFVYLDIDFNEINAANIDKNLLKKKIFFDFDNCVASWDSFSGQGIGCLFYTGVSVKDEYSIHYELIANELQEKYNVLADAQCKNVGRGNFLSFDENILIKNDLFNNTSKFKELAEKFDKKLSKNNVPGASIPIPSELDTDTVKMLDDIYIFLKDSGKNLTNGKYADWRNMLFGLCDFFISDEKLYLDWAHKLSELDYESYTFSKCAKQAEAIRKACLRNINKSNRITISSVLNLAKNAGYIIKPKISEPKNNENENNSEKKKKKENKGLAYDRLFRELWADAEFVYFYFQDNIFFRKNKNEEFSALTDDTLNNLLKEAWLYLDRSDINKTELGYMIESTSVLQHQNELDFYFKNLQKVEYDCTDNSGSEFIKLCRCFKIKPGAGFTKIDGEEVRDEVYVAYCLIVFFTQCIRNSYMQVHNSHTGFGHTQKKNEYFCKYSKKGDNILLMHSAQGAGKSTFFQNISFGRNQNEKNALFKANSSFTNASDDKRTICHTFIILDDEGVSTKTKEIEELKANSSATAFTYRKPYATRQTTSPALANFIINTNHIESLLVDNSGLSRFLILDIEQIDWQLLNSINVDKFWAEMLYMAELKDDNGTYVKYKVERKDLPADYMNEYMSRDWMDDSISKFLKIDASNFMTINEIYIELYYLYHFNLMKDKEVARISIPEPKKAQKDKLGRLLRLATGGDRVQKKINGQKSWGYNVTLCK